MVRSMKRWANDSAVKRSHPSKKYRAGHGQEQGKVLNA